MTMLAAIVMTSGGLDAVLAQGRGDDGDNTYEWAVIVFVIVASLLSSLFNWLKKKKGEDVDEDEGEILIELPRPPEKRQSAGPPVARRAQPPAVGRPGERPQPARRPATRRPLPPRPQRETRPKPVAPAAKRRPVQRVPTRPPQPVQRPPQPRPIREPAPALGRGAIDHARHVAEEAKQIARHAEQATSQIVERHVQTTIGPDTGPATGGQAKGLGLASASDLRRAIVLREIFGPPIALRGDPERF